MLITYMDIGMQAFIDISLWWPKGDDGQPLSVYKVHERFEDTPYQITPHTLTVARDDKLAKADIANLVKLAKICSELSGTHVTINDLVKVQKDEGDGFIAA